MNGGHWHDANLRSGQSMRRELDRDRTQSAEARQSLRSQSPRGSCWFAGCVVGRPPRGLSSSQSTLNCKLCIKRFWQNEAKLCNFFNGALILANSLGRQKQGKEESHSLDDRRRVAACAPSKCGVQNGRLRVRASLALLQAPEGVRERRCAAGVRVVASILSRNMPVGVNDDFSPAWLGTSATRGRLPL
jgi:hypothetical protein